MQPVAGTELQEERHRCADEMSAGRLGTFSDIDVLLDRATGRIRVVSVNAGVMVDILLQDAELTDRGIVPFTSGGDSGGSDPGFAFVEESLLCVQLDHNGDFSRVVIGNFRGNKIGHGPAPGKTESCRDEEGNRPRDRRTNSVEKTHRERKVSKIFLWQFEIFNAPNMIQSAKMGHRVFPYQEPHETDLGLLTRIRSARGRYGLWDRHLPLLGIPEME
jgi:hypothetical protein